jgi:2-C-methyl-D-erythritol 2,4-cyclodiphosphate synthase
VIDAILGAAGEGDLGTLFPPDEEQWRDANSLDLLTVALGRVSGRVVNVDATLICEQPRIGPHRAEMERNITEASSAVVSVKATTNEGMGWVGRGEGIACVAVVLLDVE